MPPIPPAAPAAAAWLGTWSRPPDRPAQIAVSLALAFLLIALAPGGPRWLGSIALLRQSRATTAPSEH